MFIHSTPGKLNTRWVNRGQMDKTEHTHKSLIINECLFRLPCLNQIFLSVVLLHSTTHALNKQPAHIQVFQWIGISMRHSPRLLLPACHVKLLRVCISSMRAVNEKHSLPVSWLQSFQHGSWSSSYRACEFLTRLKKRLWRVRLLRLSFPLYCAIWYCSKMHIYSCSWENKNIVWWFNLTDSVKEA